MLPIDEQLKISAYFSEIDGKIVVQIDTPNILLANNGMPVFRIRINDARVWEGFEDGTEDFGDLV